MKKILAIAVATAISAPAMADMTISGTVIAGYSQSTDLVKTVTTGTASKDPSSASAVLSKTSTSEGDAGFGIDTAGLTIAGSETTEGGLTVAGSMSVGGLQRAGSIGGENASLSLSGDFGSVAVSSVKVTNTLLPSAGPADNFAGEITGETVLDLVKYTLPAMGNFTVAVDFTDAPGIGTDNGDIDPSVTVAYKGDGALSGMVNYKQCASASTCDSRVRVSATMDMGVAAVNATYEAQQNDETKTTAAKTDIYAAAVNPADVTVTGLGVTVPMGATTLGLSYVNYKKDGAEADTGMSFAVSQALSENISASLKYNSYDSALTSDRETATYALVTLAF